MPEDTGRRFYRRSMGASAFWGLWGALLATVYAGPAIAGRYLLFLGWSLANFWLWGVSLREILGPRRAAFLAPLVTAKLGWIAVVVALCVWTGVGRSAGNFFAFLLGFGTPFLVMFLKSLGGWMTQDLSPGTEGD
ncbi:MAG TPA: hypothetical protein VM492_12435 [Sumerlaeia bacterium]|nr:hypothetical protein [Sumerlaeia bacterium]